MRAISEDDMTDETFEGFVSRERARLHSEREVIFTQQQELENKLAGINRELAAIEAYESAKTGTLAARPAARGPRRASSARRGSKRDELLRVIRESNGLTRGEILDKMRLKGNRSGEMSVSNALTALTKSNQIRREENRKYVIA
jgi:hypothetical protein